MLAIKGCRHESGYYMTERVLEQNGQKYVTDIEINRRVEH